MNVVRVRISYAYEFRGDGQTALESAVAFRSVLTRWRQQVSVALQCGNYEVYAAATLPSMPPHPHVHAQPHPVAEELWEHAVG